jgi:hypothetical protein
LNVAVHPIVVFPDQSPLTFIAKDVKEESKTHKVEFIVATVALLFNTLRAKTILL